MCTTCFNVLEDAIGKNKTKRHNCALVPQNDRSVRNAAGRILAKDMSQIILYTPRHSGNGVVTRSLVATGKADKALPHQANGVPAGQSAQPLVFQGHRSVFFTGANIQARRHCQSCKKMPKVCLMIHVAFAHPPPKKATTFVPQGTEDSKQGQNRDKKQVRRYSPMHIGLLS